MTELRERCIELGRDAMGHNDGWRWWAPRHLAKLFDLWEPIIRADERGRLRAKIAADIEAGREELNDIDWDRYSEADIRVGLNRAARIARGEDAE